MGFETEQDAENWAERAELAADAAREERLLASDKNEKRAKAEAESMRASLLQMDKVDLVDAAVQLYATAQRLRYDLDDLVGTIR